jgi:ABC-2 type transport system ATP-binding protein
MSAAILVSELRKTYANGVEALKGIDLTVAEGDFFALLGPNGAGKTTLIGILTSLVNKSSGEAKIFDASIETNPSLAKTYIGVVPQEFNFNIFEKVIDIVTTQAGYYGIPRKQALQKAEVLLKALGLWDKRYQPSQGLSGGMKRRLMIARGLVHGPKLLILDEPTAGVDVEMRLGMWDFLRKLNKEGTTIILTTHNLEEAEALCRNIAIINKGTIIVNDSMQDLLASRGHASLEQIYLDLIKKEEGAPAAA